eukprot:Selendium_serpulae@DN435_c0_g1_i1.p2
MPVTFEPHSIPPPPARALTLSADLPLTGNSVSFCLSWKFVESRPTTDLDLQAVAIDRNGSLVDAVYYNNLKAAGRGMTHSGDSRDGKDEGVDEKVTIHLKRLDAAIPLVLVLVCCADTEALTGRATTLGDVAEGSGSVVDDERGDLLYHFAVAGQGAATAYICAALVRGADNMWGARFINETASGHNFMDLLNTGQLGAVIRRFIPDAPMKQKCAFA